MNKTVQGVFSPPSAHWVGNGFPVRTLFDYNRHGPRISPFLMLDHAGPAHFDASDVRHGVGAHPHRGFETVTIVYEGEVSHRDTTGAGGTIGPSEVQWMTAGSGLLHEEYHSDAFTRRGGQLEMVQLWVNLPAAHKMDAPRYQALTQSNIPEVALPDGEGTVRVIAGDYEGHAGAAMTHTPMNVWDMRLQRDAVTELHLPEGHTLMVMVVRGMVDIQGQTLHNGQLAQLSRSGERLRLHASTDAIVLVLGGAPINEPIAGQGPFVMNTRQEVAQAFDDFYRGKFGSMPAPSTATEHSHT